MHIFLSLRKIKARVKGGSDTLACARLEINKLISAIKKNSNLSATIERSSNNLLPAGVPVLLATFFRGDSTGTSNTNSSGSYPFSFRS